MDIIKRIIKRHHKLIIFVTVLLLTLLYIKYNGGDIITVAGSIASIVSAIWMIRSKSSDENNEPAPLKGVDSFQGNLSDLLDRMNVTQIGKFLTVSVARSIVCSYNRLSRILNNEECVSYLNTLLISLGYNCILFFSDDRLTRDCARARARDLNLTLNNSLTLACVRRNSIDFTYDLNLARELPQTLKQTLNRTFIRARDRNQRQFMIKDAETILNGEDNFSYDTSFEMSYMESFSAFLDVLEEYWAKWFNELFNSKFCLQKDDIEAIFTLSKNQSQKSIEEPSDYLRDFIRGNDYNNEIRLMILGDKGSGKTSFARRFVNPKADMPDVSESTEGIDFDEYIISEIPKNKELIDINNNTERDVTIKIWDFAGHKVTHVAHKFFLSKRCVYVIVCQSKLDKNSSIKSEIEYWLEIIRDNSRRDKDTETIETVFVLINKWDDYEPYIEKSFENNYKEYKLIYRYLNIKKDNEEAGKLNDFKHELKKFILSTDTRIPKIYKKIQESINLKLKKKYFISKERVIRIIKDNCGEDKRSEYYETILENLHDWGYYFWFRKTPGINKTIVLNPSWITGAIYKIINWAQNSKVAFIKKSDFGKVLRVKKADKSKFPKGQDSFIFEAMKHFELAYSDDNEKLVIPNCLEDIYPDNESGLKYDHKDSVQIEFYIQELPRQRPEFPIETIPLFIVKNYESIHKNSEDKPMISLYGAMFDGPNGTIAEINGYFKDNYRICISAKGNDFSSNTDYLYKLADSLLNKVLSGYKRFDEQKPEILYDATQENGEQCRISIKDLVNNDPKKIVELYELKEEEFNRVNTIVKSFSSLVEDMVLIGDQSIAQDEISPINKIEIYPPNIKLAGNKNKLAGNKNKLADLISEVRRHIEELSEEEQNEVNYLLIAIEEEVKKDKPNIWAIESFSDSLSKIAKDIHVGLISNAIAELVQWIKLKNLELWG